MGGGGNLSSPESGFIFVAVLVKINEKGNTDNVVTLRVKGLDKSPRVGEIFQRI
jgi:hypothetical protein